MEQPDYLLLKWGTIKEWNFENSPEAIEAKKEYNDIGSCVSAMAQQDTERQKQLICIMIDKVNGPVSNDWTGKVYKNKQDAKDYVLQYGVKNRV